MSSTSASISLAVFIRGPGHPFPFQGWIEGTSLPLLNLWSSSRNTGQEPLPETSTPSSSTLSVNVQHPGGALQSLSACPAMLHIQHGSFLSGLPRPQTYGHTHDTRNTGNPRRALKCGTLPTRTLAYRNEAGVMRPPLPIKSMQPSLRRSEYYWPSAKHRTAATSTFSTVLSRSLISRDLFETRSYMYIYSYYPDCLVEHLFDDQKHFNLPGPPDGSDLKYSNNWGIRWINCLRWILI